MRLKLYSLTVLVLLAATPYLSTLAGDFVYDDSSMVIENKNVTGGTSLYQVFFDRRVMTFSGEIYRPLRDITYRLDWLIGGKEPMVYHATNILLHAITTLSVYWLLFLLSGNGLFSFMTAALFGVHPVHTESVAWIKGRDDLLFTLFYILSFGMYLIYEKSGNRRRLFYSASASLFILSLFSKEMAVTLPLAILLYQGTLRQWRPLTVIPFFMIAALYMVLRTHVLGQVAQQEYWGGGLVPTALTMVKGIGQYVRLSLLPINLCADYFSFPISRSIDFEVLAALFFLISISVCFVLTKNRFIRFGGVFFFMALLPVSNIIPIKIVVAERFLYLPLLGLCIVLVSLLSSLGNERRRFAVFGLIAFLFFMLTIQRAKIWGSEYSLWSDTLKKVPSNARAHYGLGTAYAAKGMLGEAIVEYQKSIMFGYYNPDPFNALGLAYYKKGMAMGDDDLITVYTEGGIHSLDKKRLIKEAFDLYEKALEIDPKYRDARYNLSLLYHEQGMLNKAEREYIELLKYYPEDVDALNGLGLAYFQKGLFRDAIAQYRKVLAIDPRSVGVYNNMGMAYAAMGRMNVAEGWFKKALSIDPKSAEAYYNLGFMYQNMGDKDMASSAYRKALAISPDYKESKERLKELEG